MALRIREFQNGYDTELFLRGGIRGGKKVVNASGLVQNLHSKTLIFNTPSATVTFDESAGVAGIGGGLTCQEIAAQIVAVASGLSIGFRDGTLSIVETSPSAGVALDAAGTANAPFGFSGATDSVGVVIAVKGGTAPTLEALVPKANNDGYVAVIDEA
jgi:hypothetical protein